MRLRCLVMCLSFALIDLTKVSGSRLLIEVSSSAAPVIGPSLSAPTEF